MIIASHRCLMIFFLAHVRIVSLRVSNHQRVASGDNTRHGVSDEASETKREILVARSHTPYTSCYILSAIDRAALYPVLRAKSSPATRNVVKLNSLKSVLSGELWPRDNGRRASFSRKASDWISSRKMNHDSRHDGVFVPLSLPDRLAASPCMRASRIYLGRLPPPTFNSTNRSGR